MRSKRRTLIPALAAAVLALAPLSGTPAVVSAAQAAKILAAVNEVKRTTGDIMEEVDGLNDLTKDTNDYLKAIHQVNTGLGGGLKLINDTQLAHHQQLLETLNGYSGATAPGEANAALVGDAYASRAGHSSKDLANSQLGCQRGWAARLAGNAAAMPTAEGASTSVAASVAQELAHSAGERYAPTDPEYVRALFAVPEAMKTGAQYSAAAAFAEEDLKQLKQVAWLTAPKPASRDAQELAHDGVRYGLARQVQAHWYAGLLPLAKGYGGSEDLASRYTPEALPVVWDGDQALVPAHGLLRAEALNSWYDASPVDPSESYNGWLLSLDQAGLLRENARLAVIQNRLLYELLVYTRFGALIQAEADLRQ